MYYDEYHNHKWARNLKHGRKLLAENSFDMSSTTARTWRTGMYIRGCG